MDYRYQIEALGGAILARAEHSVIRRELVRLLKTSSIDDIVFRCHPLGLIDMPLDYSPIAESRRRRQRATIHLWHPNIAYPQEPQPQCHSHGWDLLSTVLHGALENQLVYVRGTADGDLYLYAIHYSNDVSVSIRTGSACTITGCADPSTQATGSVYSVPGDVYHRSEMVASDSVVVTAMVSNNSSTNTGARSVLAADTAVELQYERTRLGPRETTALVNDMVDSLSTGGSVA
jgi:hypothetical protein